MVADEEDGDVAVGLVFNLLEREDGGRCWAIKENLLFILILQAQYTVGGQKKRYNFENYQINTPTAEGPHRTT